MRRGQFKKALLYRLREKFPKAKIEIKFINRAEYEIDYGSSFKVLTVIDFVQPIAIVKITTDREIHYFLAYIDKQEIGRICEQDQRWHLAKSSIANFETKL